MKAGRLLADIVESAEVRGLVNRRVVMDRDSGHAVTLGEAIHTLGLALDRADIDVWLTGVSESSQTAASSTPDLPTTRSEL